MAEFSKQSNFSQDALGVDKIVECSSDLLYRDLLPVLGVERGYYHAIGPVPYWLDQFVLCVNLQNSGPVAYAHMYTYMTHSKRVLPSSTHLGDSSARKILWSSLSRV